MSLRSEQAARLSLALPERTAAVVLKNGQRVSLYVRSVNADGTARVQVAGADITARVDMPEGSFLQAGRVLKGRVFFEDGKVYIRLAQPAVTNSFSHLLASNGIAPSEAAFRALQLFYASGMRMEPPAIRQALTLAAAFPGKEARAAEAAALLLQKELPLTEETLKAALAIIEGKVLQDDGTSAEEDVLPFNPDAKDKDGGGEGRESESGHGRAESQKGKAENPDFFSAFAGGGAGEDAKAGPTWLILPFKRDFGGMECAGSIRFLVGGAGGKAIETRITAVSSSLDERRGFSADFVINEGGCRFTLSPEPEGRQAAKLADELSKELKKAGLAAATEYGFATAVAQAKSVDIEA